jgi:hypothetical protein
LAIVLAVERVSSVRIGRIIRAIIEVLATRYHALAEILISKTSCPYAVLRDDTRYIRGPGSRNLG